MTIHHHDLTHLSRSRPSVGDLPTVTITVNSLLAKRKIIQDKMPMTDETRDKTLVKKYFGNERNPDDRTMGQACERLRVDAYSDGWNAAIDKIISIKRELYSPVTTATLENFIKELESLKR